MRVPKLTVAAAGLLVLLQAPSGRAGGTNPGELFTPNGTGSGTANGDYISDATAPGLNTSYHYFIEVPPGLNRLVVDIFDADIGLGAPGEEGAGRDRDRGTFNTSVTYTLFDPSNTSQATLTGDATNPAGGDNAWINLYGNVAPVFQTQTTNTTVAATTNSLVINVPAGTAAGNLLVAGITKNDGAVAVTAPAGWTTVNEGQCNNNNAGTGTCRLGVFYHVYAATGEPASYTFSWTGAAQAAVGGILRFSGVDTANPIDVSAVSFGNTANPVAPSVTTTGTNRRVVRFAGVDTAALTAAPATSRFVLTATGGSDVSGGASEAAQAVEGASGTATFTATAQPWRTVTLALRPSGPTAPAAGHWELRVDMNAGDSINAFGLRALDGTAGGGTELNVYFDSHSDFGVNPTLTKTYTVYPYVVSGCTAFENDFDLDSNSAVGQSIAYTSRSGGAGATPQFTQTILNGALSPNNAWIRSPINSWTTPGAATKYGIWEEDVAIASYAGGNGNYGNIYTTNFASGAAAPAANPTTNAFRTYLATTAGVAPVKPYLEQFYGYLSGARTATVGQRTNLTVTVRLVNPTTLPVTFSATNLVTSNVPNVTGSLGYQGNAQVTQGTITSQPALNGFGNVTWNPGTVAANTTLFLFYNVSIQPTTTPQTIALTGVVSTGAGTNGTRATFVDETGNATQGRALMTLGPICEMSVIVSAVTPVVVSSFRAHEGPRGVEVEWETASEVGTAGFDLLRWDPATASYATLNKRLIPGLQGSPQGGRYRFVDEEVSPFGKHWYVLSEAMASGERRFYGPYDVQVEQAPASPRRALSADGLDRTPRGIPGALSRSLLARQREAATRPAPPVQGVTALKIGVERDGMYHVSAASIAAAFRWPVAQVRALLASKGLALTSQGKPVAWTPTPGGLLFYGRGIDSIYTRDNVYWLGPGHGAVMDQADGGRPAPTGSASFLSQVRAEENHLGATAVSTDPESDYWYWDFLSGGDPTYGSRTFPVTAAGVDSGGGAGRLTIQLQGATATGVAGEHHVVARLNGSPVGDVRWEGIAPAVIDVPVSASLLQPGVNSVELEALLDGSAPYSILYVDGFDLAYERIYQADGGALSFRGDGQSVVTVGGFADSGITVFDVTEANSPRRVTRTTVSGTAGAFQVSLVPAGPDAQYVATTSAGWLAPKWIKPGHAPALRSRGRGAAYLVVTTADLLAPAKRLAALRQKQGLASAVVDVADIMDEFGAGISNPHAVEAFLRWAASRWSPAPRFLVLAGLGTFDYKDYLGYGSNLLPPLMVPTPSGLFASDNRLADLDGDGVPDLAVGRIPVLTAGEMDAYVSKVAAYESSDGGDWKGRAVWAADKIVNGSDFGADAERLEAGLPAGYAADRVYLADGTLGASRAQLLADLQEGAGLMNYVGHGGIDRLAAEGLLLSTDAAALTNGARLPFLTALTCTINRFEVPGYVSLGGEFVKNAGGGFSAVWAPTGLSVNFEANALGARFYAELAEKPAARLGDLVLDTLHWYAASGSEPSLITVYNFLGDPALVVKAPALPDPPSGPPPAGGERPARMSSGRRRPE